MNVRISLDSDLWDELVGGSEVRKGIKALFDREPTAGEVSNLISVVDGAEYMEHAFYYLVPYLVDLFERYPQSLRSSMVDFSRGLIHINSHNPPDECKAQVIALRPRIVAILLRCLEFGPFDDDFETHLGAVAAIYGRPDLGRNVMFIGVD